MQNESLPQTLQVIYRAIDEQKCLYFDYSRFDITGQQQIIKTYRHIRPIQVVWEQEHYYWWPSIRNTSKTISKEITALTE